MDEMYHKGRQAMDETYQQGTRLVDGFVNEVLHDNQGGDVTYHADEEYRILGMSVITFIAVAVSVGVVFIVLICALCCWCCHCCCCAKKTQQVIIYPPNPNNNPLNVSTTTYAPLPTGPGLPPDPGFVNQLYTQQRGRQGFSDDEMLEVQCYDQGRPKNHGAHAVPLATMGSG